MKTPMSIVCLAFALAGCPAADDVAETEGEEEQETSGGQVECDPVGANPALGELLNAPIADDVEVIVKTPQHPGEPGPDNLP